MGKYDAVVIGGGPGGYVCAIRLAILGKKTAIIEKRDFGGTCLNRGCIPTKTLLHSEDVYHEIASAKKLGLKVEGVSFDYGKIAKRKDKVVKQLRSGVENLLKGHGAEIIRGEAKLVDAHTIQVGEETIEAENIVLAMGSEPAALPVPGADLPGVMNSDGVMELTECPESVVIVGGGVIGVEFATLFSGLGAKVTIIEMLPSILYGNDKEVCSTMDYILKDRGVAIYTGAKLKEIKEGMCCVFEKDGEELTAEGQYVIIAAGRKPQTKDMGLEAAGVEVGPKGFVPVDDELHTNVPHIYAIGDITGKIQLAHVATAQGMAAAHNIAGAHKTMAYNAVPSCIYTTPEIACVGMTEEKAAEAGYEVKAGKFGVSGNGRSLAINSPDGFAKIVADAKTGKILGCHIVSACATEMIGEVTLAIAKGMTIEDVSDVIHAHPTVSEIIMEAEHDIEGLCCHKM